MKENVGNPNDFEDMAYNGGPSKNADKKHR